MPDDAIQLVFAPAVLWAMGCIGLAVVILSVLAALLPLEKDKR